MARDLDFHKQARQTPAFRPAKKSIPSSLHADFYKPEVHKSSNKSGRVSSFWNNLLIGVLFILVMAGIIYGIYYANKSIAPNSEIKGSNGISLLKTNLAQAASISPTSNTNLPTVDIYDSGAGSTDLTLAIKELKAAGFNPTNLGKSQYQYNQTYVWYQPAYQAQAQQIASTLSGRQTATESTAITGSFNILIYLGVK